MWDVHAHHVPSAALESARTSGSLGVSYDPAARVLTRPAGPSRPVPPALMDLAGTLERARGWGVEVQIVSPWLDLTDHSLPRAEAAAWSRELNDALAAAIEAYDMFRGIAALPLGNGDDAAAELTRAVDKLGFLGGMVDTQICGRNLSEAGLEALFEVSARKGAVLFLHPFEVLGRTRLQQHFMTNTLGNPFETTVAALDLVFSGVFERHPTLKVLLAHTGGTLPFIAGRAAHGSKAVGSGPGLDTDEILRLFYYDTVLHDAAALAFAVRRIGADRFVIGTDDPFPMAIEDPKQHVEHVEGSMGEKGLLEAFARVTEELFAQPV